MSAEASRSWEGLRVSTTSVLVRPKWSSGRIFFLMRRRVDLHRRRRCEGDDVVADLVLDFVMRSDGGSFRGRRWRPAASLGDEAERARAWDAAVSTVSQQRNYFVGPECGHGRTCVTGDHRGLQFQVTGCELQVERR